MADYEREIESREHSRQPRSIEVASREQNGRTLREPVDYDRDENNPRRLTGMRLPHRYIQLANVT